MADTFPEYVDEKDSLRNFSFLTRTSRQSQEKQSLLAQPVGRVGRDSTAYSGAVLAEVVS